MTPFPPWVWDVPARFNVGAACTDAHLGTAVASRAAVIVDDDGAGTASLTYAALADRVARVGTTLGLGAGERVLIRLPNCLAYPTAFLGALRAGLVAVPTSTQLTADEVRWIAGDAGATVLVCDRPTWAAMQHVLEALPDLRRVLLVGEGASPSPRRLVVDDFEAALAAAVPAPPHPTCAHDPAYLVYTSGTTGFPKGVLHAHRALLGRQPSSEYWFDFRPEGDRVLHAGKYNWTYTLGTGLMDPLYRGHTTIVHEGAADATRWPQLIARHAASIFIAVPTIYRHILQKTAATARDVPTLRHCMSAGEPLSSEMLAAWRAPFGQNVYEAQGTLGTARRSHQHVRLPRLAARGRSGAVGASGDRRGGGGGRDGGRRQDAGDGIRRTAARHGADAGGGAGMGAGASGRVQGAARRVPRGRPAADAQRQGAAARARAVAGSGPGAGLSGR